MLSNHPYWFPLLCILSSVLCFRDFLCRCFLLDIFSSFILSSFILSSFILSSFILLSLILLSFCVGWPLSCANAGAIAEPANKVATKNAALNFLFSIVSLSFGG